MSNGTQIRRVPSGAQVADSPTKAMDNTMLRECLRLGKYCLHDERKILKARSDSRTRRPWLRQNAEAYRELWLQRKAKSSLEIYLGSYVSSDQWRYIANFKILWVCETSANSHCAHLPSFRLQPGLREHVGGWACLRHRYFHSGPCGIQIESGRLCAPCATVGGK